MRTKQFLATVLAVAALLGLSVSVTRAQGPIGWTFAYQGRLTDGANAANGAYDFQFKLFNAPTAGTQVGGVQTKDNLAVSNGLFNTTLDFGAGSFNGQQRFLEIAVRPGSSTGAYTLLSPRQQLNASPYALFSTAPWAPGPSLISYMGGKVGIGTTNPLQKLHLSGADSRLRLESTSSGVWTTTEYKTNTREWHTGVGGSTVPNGVANKFYIFDGTYGQFRMVIESNTGNVGFGTTAPSAQMSIVKSGAPQPTVQNVATGLKVGMPAGTIPLALKQNGAESSTPALAFFETANGDLGSIGAASGALVLGGAANKALAFNVNGSTRAMTIASNGAIGVGTANISSRFEIKSTGTTNATSGFRVTNANGTAVMLVRDDGSIGLGTGNPAATNRVQISSPGTTNTSWGLNVFNGVGNSTFAVRDDGRVWIGHLGATTSNKHVCIDGSFSGYLVHCASAAEYVPTIDGGEGFPETADVVSIAPNVKNPYGDAHGPFTVQKSATACDPNLLGFILNPESGADGKKLNDHYLPLAIFGYFPAKVTLENGPIKRGDPLTSSSKPGYAMKATDACKIIGYALEDAKAEGQIQVFADLGDNASSQVRGLEEQLKTQDAQILKLNNQIETMQKQNTALEQRLAALEQYTKANSAATALNAGPMANPASQKEE